MEVKFKAKSILASSNSSNRCDHHKETESKKRELHNDASVLSSSKQHSWGAGLEEVLDKLKTKNIPF